MCLDPRPLNAGIKREYQIPITEDITTRLSGAKYFSKFDANHGNSWPLLTRHLRDTVPTYAFWHTASDWLYFNRHGIKSAQEVFQKKLSQQFGDLDDVKTDIDDILFWGTTRSELHDHCLRNVLKRCEKVNLTLNPENGHSVFLKYPTLITSCLQMVFDRIKRRSERSKRCLHQ